MSFPEPETEALASLGIREDGLEGLKNYGHALWGKGHVPHPDFPAYVAQLFRAQSERIAALEARINWLQVQIQKPEDLKDMGLICPPAGAITGKTLQQILSQVAKKHTLTQGALKSRQREADVCAARNEAYYESYLLGKSLPQIGRFYGGRDHTTILSGIRKHMKDNGIEGHVS